MAVLDAYQVEGFTEFLVSMVTGVPAGFLLGMMAGIVSAAVFGLLHFIRRAIS